MNENIVDLNGNDRGQFLFVLALEIFRNLFI